MKDDNYIDVGEVSLWELENITQALYQRAEYFRDLRNQAKRDFDGYAEEYNEKMRERFIDLYQKYTHLHNSQYKKENS